MIEGIAIRESIAGAFEDIESDAAAGQVAAWAGTGDVAEMRSRLASILSNAVNIQRLLEKWGE